jgi:hypothetical protein
MRLGVAVVVLVLAACRGPLAVGAALTSPADDPAWVTDPGLAARAAAAARTMAGVWGGDPSSFDGWTITFLDRHIERRGTSFVVGKTTHTPILGGGRIEIWTGTSKVCVEATNLAHEVGHVVVGDHHHRDPRWLDREFWERMAQALRATVPPEDVPCRERLAAGKGIWH